MAGTDRVVIVGAGVSGLAIAHQLAPEYDVVVLEKNGIMSDTSSRASGVISLGLEPIPQRWKTTARGAFRDLDGKGVFSFTERETVRLHPASAADEIEEPGNSGEYLSREALLARYPDIFESLAGYTGGTIYDDTGMIDVLDYASTLKSQAEATGARIYRDHQVTDLRVEDDTVCGVTTEYGAIDADTVVYATGWRMRTQLQQYVQLPIQPLRWNAIVFETPTQLPKDLPMGSEPALRMYWRPLGDRGVLVGGNEHLVADPDNAPKAIEDEFRQRVIADVTSLLQPVQEGMIRREDCCPTADTATPDGRPIVDMPPEAPDGLIVATGFHGRGVMLSPITARAVRAIVTGETPEIPLAPLRVGRFADRSSEFAYQSHWDPEP